MRVVDCVQGTEEWLSVRLGKFTASRMADLTAQTKSGYGASRRNYLADLLVERMTGIPTEYFVTKEMLRGTALEPEARTTYEFQTGSMVAEVGFVLHPEIDYAGASPDGLIGADGGVEIKCPNTATHVDTLMTGKIPEKYVQQMQWNMTCCEREWWDYISYDPRMKDQRLVLYRKRVARDDALIATLVAEVQKAESDLQAMVGQMDRLAEELGS